MIAGIALALLGASLLVAEAHVPSAGVLGVAGVAGVGSGVVVMLAAAGSGLIVTVVLAGVIVLGCARLLLWASVATAAAHRRRARTGPEALIGQVGVVRGVPLHEGGHVFLEGALWRAEDDEISDGAHPLAPGDRVVVENVNGLTLSVRRAEEWESS